MPVASTKEKPTEAAATVAETVSDKTVAETPAIKESVSGEKVEPTPAQTRAKTEKAAHNALAGMPAARMVSYVLMAACALSVLVAVFAVPKLIAAGGVGIVATLLAVLLMLAVAAALVFYKRQEGETALLSTRAARAEEDNRKLADESSANRRLALDMQTSEERFRSLSAASPLGIFEMDTQGNCLYANERWQEITGQSKEETVGKGWTRVLYGADRESTLTAWEEAAVVGRSFERDVRLVTQQGMVRWVQIHANPLPTRSGDVTRRFVGTIADITERKRAEDAVRTSEMRFRSVVESAMDGILLVDGRGTLLSWNQGAQSIFGYTEDEAIGRSITFVLPTDFRESYWQGIAQVQVREGIDGRKMVSRTVEVMGMRRDGVEFPLEISLSAYRSGDEVFYSAVLRDISERKRAELMRQEKEIAEEANRAKSQFLANMSHELRTPLNAIIGFSEILQDRTFGDLNAKQGRYVENILNSGRHLLQLINDILDLSKIEAGKMELEPATFSIGTAINDVYNIVKGVAMKREVNLIQQAPEGLPSVVADQSKFKQILYNLLSNAIKFTPAGKNVTVAARVVEGPMMEITVRDEGIGIKKSDQDRIFREFEQADNSFSRKEQGTGLGLALTKRFVELHGGRIWVESDGEGFGSTFGFLIPLDATAVPTEESTVEGAEATVPTVQTLGNIAVPGASTVMVVEDDAAAGELISGYLQEAGYNVVVVSDAQNAIAQARALKPAAITLDVMLSQKDNWKLLSELKAHPDTERIPVIVVTVTADQDLAFSLGAVECFTKPVDKDRLIQALYAARSADKETTTVLVVDDNPTTVEMLTDTLQMRGFNVIPAFGGQEAIDRATSELPDIIVLDLMMPHVSGFDVVKKLQDHPEAKNIPILIYTANEVTDEARAELSKHVKAIMPKRGKAALLRELEVLAGQPKAERKRGKARTNGSENGTNGHAPENVADAVSEAIVAAVDSPPVDDATVEYVAAAAVSANGTHSNGNGKRSKR
jgi:PAS domain S-box-containing protein